MSHSGSQRLLVPAVLTLVSLLLVCWLVLDGTRQPDPQIPTQKPAVPDLRTDIESPPVRSVLVPHREEAERGIAILVTDTADPRPVEGVTLEMAASWERLLRRDFRVMQSDSRGMAATDLEESCWLRLSKAGYESKVVSDADPVWYGADSRGADGERLVTLELRPASVLSVIVRDYLDRPIAGADLRAFGAWGYEALAVARGEPEAAAGFLSTATTDGSGLARVTMPADFVGLWVGHPDYYRGYVRRMDTLPPGPGTPTVVHLGRLLAAGIEVPLPSDWKMILHGESGKSHSPEISRSQRASLEARLRDRVAGENIVWLLAKETRALSPEEEWQRLSCRPRPWSAYQELRVRYVPVAQISRADVVVIEDDPRTLPMGELLVEPGDLASTDWNRGWGVYSAEFDQWWLPSNLPAADQADPATGHAAFHFRLYAGHYTVRSVSRVRGWRETIEVELKGGESRSVRLPDDDPGSTIVHLDVADGSGREIRFYTLVFSMLPGGPSLLRPGRPQRGEPASGWIRVANGEYRVDCSATGLGHCEEIVVLDGGEMDLSLTLQAQ